MQLQKQQLVKLLVHDVDVEHLQQKAPLKEDDLLEEKLQQGERQQVEKDQLKEKQRKDAPLKGDDVSRSTFFILNNIYC